MYEPRRVPPIPRPHYLRRLLNHFLVSGAFMAFSLMIGIWGYERFEGLKWRDAFLNASMLLGGMGPVDPPKSDSGKLFAGTYALYSGLVFLVAASVLLAPMVHRLLHKFHWESDDSG